MTNITITGSVTSIPEKTFYNWPSLSFFTILGSVTYIEKEAFYNCNSLINITITGSIESIGNRVFYNCTSLKNLIGILPSIGNETFYNCVQLTSLTFSGILKYIGNNAFVNCISLKNITFLNNFNTITYGYDLFSIHSDIPNFFFSPINIFIPGNFIVEYSGRFGIQRGSHLYVTRNTIMTRASQEFFGWKSVYVHYDNKKGISNQTTIDVLQYISIENITIRLILPETVNDFLFYKHSPIYLSFAIICLNTYSVS